MFDYVHNVTSVVVFLSSTLNPFIYGLWGKHFRAGMWSSLGCIGNGSEKTVTRSKEGVCVENGDQSFPNNTEDTTM